MTTESVKARMQAATGTVWMVALNLEQGGSCRSS